MFGADSFEDVGQGGWQPQSRKQLSDREMDIVKLVADGKTYREIAQILGLSSKTVDCHSQKIKRKTQCHSVALLVRLAIKNGWVEL
jgi:DNA-binding CsgD family transcriptional regulator